MFRSNLLKLNVTLVFLVAAAFVSVTEVAAAGSSTVMQLKADSTCVTFGGTADTCIPANNPNGHWIGPETVSAALSPLDNSNGHWIGPETVSAVLGQPTVLSPFDNSSGHWIGPETVSAALGQQSYSIPTTGGLGNLTSDASGRGPYASSQAP